MTRTAPLPFLVAAIAAVSVATCHAQDQGLKTFMRAKLSHSQKVLEGLVEEDYEMVDKNSQDLGLLSLAATWQVLTTPEYVDLSRQFRAATEKLSEAAKHRNLDETTKAFHVVTKRCVECHKYLRDVKFVSR